MSGKGIEKNSFSPFLRWWCEGETDSVVAPRKNCKEQVVMALSLRLGDTGVTQANTWEERRNLVGAKLWKVRLRVVG